MHVSKQPGMAGGEEIRRKKQNKHLPITLDLLPLSKICSPLSCVAVAQGKEE